jgi:cell division protein FtsQ
VVEAPVEPFGDGDASPPPPPTSRSVRPPPAPAARPAKAAAGPGRVARLAQLVAGAAIVISASAAVAWGARRYIVSSPRFAVRTVLVDGAHRRPADKLASEAGVAVGGNIFAIDLDNAGAAVTAADPWIERATVTRKLPSTIEIAVVEREARAIVSIGGEIYLATRDGDLFKRAAPEDPVDLPLVTGILPDQVGNDRAGVVLTVKRLLDVADELDRTGISKTRPLQELHLEKDGSLVATVGREAILVHLGQPPYRDKIEQASRVLGEVARRKANASVIFLDNDAHPERVVVRMR